MAPSSQCFSGTQGRSSVLQRAHLPKDNLSVAQTAHRVRIILLFSGFWGSLSFVRLLSRPAQGWTAAPRPKPKGPLGPLEPGQRSHRRVGLDERAPFKISAPSYACELVVGPEASPEYT